MFHRESFEQVFYLSGLTKSELSTIYGVSRQTLYSWTNMNVEVNDEHALDANRRTAVLLSLIKNKTLPIPRPLSRRARRSIVLSIKNA